MQAQMERATGACKFSAAREGNRAWAKKWVEAFF